MTETKKKTVKKKTTDGKKNNLPKKNTSEEIKDKKKYYEAVGRRKQSTARVRLHTCQPFEDKLGRITVNGKKYTDFFSTFELREVVASPLEKMKSLNRFELTVKVKGGGIRGQADAIRHGTARALVKFNPDFSKKLKRAT